jgi:hypothetical protein
VWRWQRRFMEAGVDALLHDKTREPGKAPVPEPIVEQLVERTLGALPGETTHWTSQAMADIMGLAISTVQKIWRAHGPAPHRLRIIRSSTCRRRSTDIWSNTTTAQSPSPGPPTPITSSPPPSRGYQVLGSIH